MVPLHVNQRARLPNEVKANRETCKKENAFAPYYMATPEEKQIDTHLKMEWQMYFSKNILGVNPVVINYKIRHNNNRSVTRPARNSLEWPDHFFRYYLWWQKNGKTRSGYERLHARVAMEEGLLSVWVSQSIGQLRSVDEYSMLPSQLGICEKKVANLM